MLLNRNPIVNDIGLMLIRMIVGIVFVFHGAQKLFGWFDGPGIEGFAGFLEQLEVPQPLLNAYLTGIAEFLGGLLLFVGLVTRLAAIPPLIVMVVAISMVHPHAFAAAEGGMEFPLTLAIVLVGLILAGPGRFSLDGWIYNACCVRTHKAHEQTRAGRGDGPGRGPEPPREEPPSPS